MLGRSLPITRMDPNFVHWQLYSTILLLKSQVIFHIFLSFNNDTGKQKDLLDKKQPYINLSEIEDADFEVSAEDKVLNRAFYGE